MDLLQGVQDAVQEQQGIDNNEDVPMDMNDMKMPSLEQIVEMIGGSNMSEEEKEELLNNLMNTQRRPGQAPETSAMEKFIILAIPLTIIIMVFVFFGYKLYKSVVEKERKRDEKRKQKQQKKKK